MSTPSYWIFSNKPQGQYGDSVWDMGWILAHRRYSLKKSEPLRAGVREGDVVYLRIYGESYIGRFIVGGEWTASPEECPDMPEDNPVGTFAMEDLVLWSRPLPPGPHHQGPVQRRRALSRGARQRRRRHPHRDGSTGL